MRAGDEVGDVCSSRPKTPDELHDTGSPLLHAPTICLPDPLPTPTRCCPPLPAQQAASGKPLIHMGEDLGDQQNADSTGSWERKARTWVGARAGQKGEDSRGDFISSLPFVNDAEVCFGGQTLRSH